MCGGRGKSSLGFLFVYLFDLLLSSLFYFFVIQVCYSMGAIQLPDSFCDPIITRLDGKVEGFFCPKSNDKSKNSLFANHGNP